MFALFPGGVLAADWPTYHGDNTRQGNDTSDPGLANATSAWTSTALDGSLYGQPVIVGAQVIVATENDTVYSLNAANGSVQWSQHLGAPRTSGFVCGNINPLGITSTPVIDGGNVYVVAEIQTGSAPLVINFVMASLALSTGAINWTHIVDPPDPSWSTFAQYQQQRTALLATGGRIFFGLGGLAGDCGSYHGFVVSYAESNTGSVTYWASSEVPGISGDNQGAIWAAGGLSQDAGGFIYAATGNSNQTSSSSPYDYSDSVIKLDPSALAPGAPVDYFAPGNWFQDNGNDADLGSVTPLQLPNNRVFIVGKSGNGYLLNTASLGHIGGQLSISRVCSATNDAAFGSLAYASGVAYVGCSDGLTAVQINTNNFTVLWHNSTNPVDHPPTVAGGLVWSISGTTLAGFNPANGQLAKSFSIASSTHFTTPSAANNQLYVSAGTHVYSFIGSCAGGGGSPLVAGFSGSGKADLAMVSRTGTCVLASTGTALGAPTYWASFPFYGSVTTLAGDVNGDGKADLVAVNRSQTFVLLSTGTAFGSPQSWATVPFYGTRGTFLADVNGDGKADLVAINDNSVWVMLSTGTGFAAPAPWSSTPFFGNVITTIGDVSGDGKADVVAVNSSSTWVMTSTGTSFSAPALWSSTPFYGSVTTTLAGVTGTGRADLVAINSGSAWVMPSTGTAFGAPAQWSSTAFYGLQGTLSGDVNGDGKADLVAVNPASVWAALSTGSSFSAPGVWFGGPP